MAVLFVAGIIRLLTRKRQGGFAIVIAGRCQAPGPESWDSGYESTFSRRVAPECCHRRNPRKLRAQGMPDARRTRSRAWWVESTRVSHHRFAGITRHSLRNGFNGLFRALLGDRALLSPSPA